MLSIAAAQVQVSQKFEFPSYIYLLQGTSKNSFALYPSRLHVTNRLVSIAQTSQTDEKVPAKPFWQDRLPEIIRDKRIDGLRNFTEVTSDALNAVLSTC